MHGQQNITNLLCVVHMHPFYSVGVCITSLRENGEFETFIGCTGTVWPFVVFLVPM